MAFVVPTPITRAVLHPSRTSFTSRTSRPLFFSRSSSRSLHLRIAMATSATSTASAPSLPARVAPNPLPSLLVYDHCPFCVRARHMLGLKNIKHNLVWLMNDDIDTPTALVGKKMVPIFQPEGPKGPSMLESLDICEMVDKDERFGTPGLLNPASGRKDIEEVMGKLSEPMRRLVRVRFPLAPLPEFVFQEGRDAFIRNHPFKDPPYDYDENIKNSAEHIAKVKGLLGEVAELIHSPYHVSPDGLSYDDIIMFPQLRALTIVKDLELPKAIRDYLDYHSKVAEVPLYDYCPL